MSKFLKNWSYLTVSSILQQGLSFLCLVRIARVLAPEGYGSYTIILASVGIAQVIGLLGLPQIVIRVVSRDTRALADVARKALPLVVSGAVVAAFGLACYLFFFERVTGQLLLFASSTLVLAQGFWSFAESLAYGRQQMAFSSTLNVASSLLWATMIFTLPHNYFTVKVVLLIFSIIQFLRPLAYFILEFRAKYFVGWSVSYETSKVSRVSLLRQSLPLFGTNVLTLPITLVPILFLGKFSGPSEVGLYGVGNKFLSPLSLISTSLLTAIYPVLAFSYLKKNDDFKLRAEQLFFAMSTLSIIFAWTLGTFGKEIILFFFGSQYAGAIVPFIVQLWTACIIVSLSYVGNILLSADKERMLVKLSLLNAVLVGSVSYLGSHYGSLGLAAFGWIGYLVGFVVHWYVLRKTTVKGVLSPTGLEKIVFALYIVLAIATYLLSSASLTERIGFFIIGFVLVLFTTRSQTRILWEYGKVVLVSHQGDRS